MNYRKNNIIHIIHKIGVAIPILCMIWFGVGGCGKENALPNYIYIRPFAPATDAWVFLDGEALGIWELPATVPILGSEGTHQLQIFTGIRNNGIRSNPIIYPMTAHFEKTIRFPFVQTDTIQPITPYNNDVNFLLNETFDSTGGKNNHTFAYDLDKDSVTAITKEQNIGKVTLTAIHPFLEVTNKAVFLIPKTTQSVYLELTFATDCPLEVGILGYENENSNPDAPVFKNYKVVLLPNDLKDRKVFIELSEEIHQAQNEVFRIAFRANSRDKNAKIELDNIRLLIR